METLKTQYGDLLKGKLAENIDALLSPDTFTITTAHQPNIFTGPLYFIYKILHAIRLAAHLQNSLPQYRFVPVYYMGSEDADLEELNHPSGRATPLSARELEVAGLVAEGLTNRGIAQRLHLSERTAENHIKNILDKLGLRKRAELVHYAQTHGLLGA